VDIHGSAGIAGFLRALASGELVAHGLVLCAIKGRSLVRGLPFGVLSGSLRDNARPATVQFVERAVVTNRACRGRFYR
jgi:hypothetical protein